MAPCQEGTILSTIKTFLHMHAPAHADCPTEQSAIAKEYTIAGERGKLLVDHRHTCVIWLPTKLVVGPLLVRSYPRSILSSTRASRPSCPPFTWVPSYRDGSVILPPDAGNSGQQEAQRLCPESRNQQGREAWSRIGEA